MKFQPINQKRLREHLRYDGWQYLVVLSVFWLCSSLFGSMIQGTRPVTDIIGVRFFGYTSPLTLSQSLAKEMKKDMPEMKKINFQAQYLTGSPSVPPPYGELNLDAILNQQNNQNLSVIFSGATPNFGDCFVLHHDLMAHYARQGSFVPLDKYYEMGLLPKKAKDLAVYFDGSDGKKHWYGIDVSGLKGIERERIMDVRYHCMGIPSGSGNPTGGAKAMAWLLENAKR